MILRTVVLFVLVAATAGQNVPPPAKQNPSPMADSTRAHRRISQSERYGRRIPLSIGSLFVPDEARTRSRMALVVHFHGAAWLAEQSAEGFDRRAAVLSVHLGSGSSVYSQAFSDPVRFRDLLAEASRAISPKADVHFDPIVLTAFSAGYGAVREILKDENNWHMVQGVVLADALHTGYVPEGAPGPLDTSALQPFVGFAREAMARRKRMVITHSEIFPGTFASTTECADYLITALGLRRRPVLKWGPGGMQQVSQVRSGHLRILGFAGNSAPDHIDHYHGLARWLGLLKR